jgi:hypothetical protein
VPPLQRTQGDVVLGRMHHLPFLRVLDEAGGVRGGSARSERVGGQVLDRGNHAHAGDARG